MLAAKARAVEETRFHFWSPWPGEVTEEYTGWGQKDDTVVRTQAVEAGSPGFRPQLCRFLTDCLR